MVGGGVKFAGDQAVLHDEQAGTQADTFVCCIAQYDYSLALIRHVADQGVDLLLGAHIDAAGGVVEQQDVRTAGQGPGEYHLLLVFISNPNHVLTRDRLLDELWDAAGEFVNDNTLSVYIKRLREKIEDDPADPQIILTVRGTGYRLGDGYVSE